MERICEEINYVSECLNLGIYLDSDYHKEYVRNKLKENSIYENLKNNNKSSEINSIISELFNL